MHQNPSNQLEKYAIASMPMLFVFLWSTGFIGAKLGLPYIEPMTFLAVRFVACSLLFLPFVLMASTRWPASWVDAAHIGFAGLLMHGGYLGSVFWAISLGVPAGTSALIAGIQPLIVAALAGFVLKETVTARQWVGLFAGLGGVFLVVANKLSLSEGSMFGYVLCFISLFSMSIGTLYQKKFCADMSLKSGNFIQFVVASLYFILLSFVMEEQVITWSGELVFALLWLVFVLSLGAVSLLYLLLRKGAASSVSSLFFLVPPCTAVVAFILFDERLGGNSLIGMGIAIFGVALVNFPVKKRA
ncbi:DMT family transporter [Sneathiella glossodoripedis]|uniref:DMT family transporter n=1 Tax=Sneathiella glossodoripedis TaxID=418853 RepID=UPI00047234DC|nr:DMT family transporter [Sneathiella glossodoripedis]